MEVPLYKIRVEWVGANDGMWRELQHFSRKKVFGWPHEGELLFGEVLLIR